jgi:hypothetical protein
MQIGRITRKVLMNWHALSFTTIFTLGLTGAVGLTTSRKTSFQKDKAKQALPFSLPCPPGKKIVPVHAVADQNWTEASAAGHAFTSSFLYSHTVKREIIVVRPDRNEIDREVGRRVPVSEEVGDKYEYKRTVHALSAREGRS